MKKLVLLTTAFVFALAAMAQPKADDIVKINTETHDFGKIKVGIPVVYFFEIKNISNKLVVVESVSASCGCTQPEKPEKPIEPNTTTKLKIEFKAGAVAPFTKDVYIKFAGVDQPKTVHITGEVLSVEDYDAWVKEKSKNKN